MEGAIFFSESRNAKAGSSSKPKKQLENKPPTIRRPCLVVLPMLIQHGKSQSARAKVATRKQKPSPNQKTSPKHKPRRRKVATFTKTKVATKKIKGFLHPEKTSFKQGNGINPSLCAYFQLTKKADLAVNG
jgi:hypothetical protein